MKFHLIGHHLLFDNQSKDILREGVWSLREESERDFGKSFREFSLERGISLKLRWGVAGRDFEFEGERDREERKSCGGEDEIVLESIPWAWVASQMPEERRRFWVEEVTKNQRERASRFFPGVSFPLGSCSFFFSSYIVVEMHCCWSLDGLYSVLHGWLLPFCFCLWLKIDLTPFLPSLWHFKERKRPFNSPICKPTNEEVKHSP